MGRRLTLPFSFGREPVAFVELIADCLRLLMAARLPAHILQKPAHRVELRAEARGERRVGRPAGMPNKTTRMLKEAGILAAEIVNNAPLESGTVGCESPGISLNGLVFHFPLSH